MEDSVVKTMKDLLFVARAYYPSIAKLPKFDKLSQEMKQNIQDFERILSEATTDKDLPPQYVEMQPFNIKHAYLVTVIDALCLMISHIVEVIRSHFFVYILD